MIAHGYRTAGRPLRRGVVLGAAALLAVLLSRPLAGPVPTAAAQAQAQSRTFNCTGATQSFTVPAGVTQLHVQADGAQGESRENPGGTGGYGEIVTATVPVTPGAVLTIYAGCAGNDGHGGFGFGSGGEHGIGHAADAQSGGGGGGGSAVIQGPIPYETVLVVAGGGGGGGGAGGDTTSGPTGWGSYGGNGGNGGHPAQAGHDGGEGGGGSGRGHGGCAASPDCVQSTNGGAGTSSSVADGGGGGGGGGGGWLGGGGGHGGRDFAELAGGGGGGGGLSYVMPSATHAGYHGPNTGGGNGIVILSWTTSEPGGEAPSPAAPAQPMTISGQVHHLVPPLVSEDQIAQTLTPDAGAQVEALVGNTVCGMAVTGADGRFQLTVGVHPATPGCGQPGATVRFRVDGGEHPEAVLFQSGGAATVALRSTAAPAPPPLGWP